jgi:predicted nucleic acid-binding protein
VKAFFDTNILVYITTSDARKQQAVDCLRGGGCASVQVLNEFVHVARRKLRHDWPQIELALGLFRASLDDVVPVTLNTHTAPYPLLASTACPSTMR